MACAAALWSYSAVSACFCHATPARYMASAAMSGWSL
jgi:hypothetical protein